MAWYSVLTKLVSPSMGDAVDKVVDVVDKFIETDEEKQAWKKTALRLHEKSDEFQQELNKIALQNRTFFTAGWRPAIGWSCWAAFTYHYLGRDLLTWAFTASGLTLPVLPVLSMDEVNGLIWAMLGISGVRQVDKWVGTSK